MSLVADAHPLPLSPCRLARRLWPSSGGRGDTEKTNPLLPRATNVARSGGGLGRGASDKRLQRVALIVALGFAIAGGGLLGKGLYIHAKAWAAQLLIHRAWAAARNGERETPPWPWADTYPVARLTVPELRVDQIVLAHASGRTLAFGPAQLDGSAAPGRPGVAVLTGHRDTHFAFLEKLRPGDTAELELPSGAAHRFRVVEKRVVHADRARLPAATEDGGSWLVLATCWPFDALDPGTPWRYLAAAR
ncbi:MAG: class GN sortase, partial [Rhodospirillales bacterium]